MDAWASDCAGAPFGSGDAERPVLVVVGNRGVLTSWFARLCEDLGLRMQAVAELADVADVLAKTRPFALICTDLGEQGRPMARLMRLVAGYDRSLAVLLMTNDEPETLGSVDAAIGLWPLDNVVRAAVPVPVETVLGFLARAGQRTNSVRLIPV